MTGTSAAVNKNALKESEWLASTIRGIFQDCVCRFFADHVYR
jgi:hypothetical protein